MRLRSDLTTYKAYPMEKLLNPGRIIFVIGFIALGFLCIVLNDFIVGRPPAWPVGFEVNPALAYLSGSTLILLSVAILLKKKGGLAAVLIAVLIFLFSVLRELPQVTSNWLNGAKSLALMGGALIVACSFFYEHPYSQGMKVGESLLDIFLRRFACSPEASDSISFINFMASMMHRICPVSTRSPTLKNGGAPGDGDS